MIGGIDPDTWAQHAWLNRLQSALLLLFMGGFLALLGWLLWGRDGIIALLFAGGVAAFINPAVSPRLVMRLYRAAPLDRQQVPQLIRALEVLSERAGLPAVPALYYVPSRMLNAFAVGNRKRAAVAVTDGLLRHLEFRELAGVLAHELSHVNNNDLSVMGLADLFSRMTTFLSLLGQLLLLVSLPLVLFGEAAVNWFAILLLIVAPNISALAQLALSRTREYDADLDAARLTGDPQGLALALRKLEYVQGGVWERILLPGQRIPDPSLLRTHPPTKERVRRLLSLQTRQAVHERLAATPAGVPYRPHRALRAPRWHVNGLWY
jgi:heat shock protein HtpX